MICWFQIVVSSSARIRVTTSDGPPAANGTMMVTGLLGKSVCARAATTETTSAIRNPKTRPIMSIDFDVGGFGDIDPGLDRVLQKDVGFLRGRVTRIGPDREDAILIAL